MKTLTYYVTWLPYVLKLLPLVIQLVIMLRKKDREDLERSDLSEFLPILLEFIETLREIKKNGTTSIIAQKDEVSQ